VYKIQWKLQGVLTKVSSVQRLTGVVELLHFWVGLRPTGGQSRFDTCVEDLPSEFIPLL
jgi:hypothetical protein